MLDITVALRYQATGPTQLHPAISPFGHGCQLPHMPRPSARHHASVPIEFGDQPVRHLLGARRRHLRPHPSMAVYGFIFSIFFIWLYMAAYGFIWFYMVLFCFMLRYMSLYGY